MSDIDDPLCNLFHVCVLCFSSLIETITVINETSAFKYDNSNFIYIPYIFTIYTIRDC